MNPAGSRRQLIGALLLGGAAVAGAADQAVTKLITLDPGHFHAALFQREMLPGVAPRVHVYAPLGPDLLAHLARVNSFNARAESPTAWEIEVHAGADYFARLLAEKPGHVVVMSGNNRGKIGRMEAMIGAGLHVLADKPWIIEPEEMAALERTLQTARAGHVIAYDGMTQRYEISCLLQKALVNDAAVFGTILPGTEREPAVFMESVHFLKKEVAGAPLLRPPWFFDPAQQGEPIADVGTHLVDLVQWMLTPETVLDYHRDLQVHAGRRSSIRLSAAEFKAVTGLPDFPGYLASSARRGALEYFGNNTVEYSLRQARVRLEARWEFAAPPGGRDTELAVFRGSRARVEVRQGAAENFVPEVYIVPNRPADHAAIEQAVHHRLQQLAAVHPGVTALPVAGGLRLQIPAALRVSHEAHFALLVRQFLAYQRQPDTLPAWEPAFLRAKYFVTTEAVRLARQNLAKSTALSRSP